MLLLQCYKIIEDPKPYEIPLCGNYSAFAKGAILAFEKVLLQTLLHSSIIGQNNFVELFEAFLKKTNEVIPSQFYQFK